MANKIIKKHKSDIKYRLSNTQTCPYFTVEGKSSTCIEVSNADTVFQTFLTFLTLIPARSQIWPIYLNFISKLLNI
jgi:hypothetical protein